MSTVSSVQSSYSLLISTCHLSRVYDACRNSLPLSPRAHLCPLDHQHSSVSHGSCGGKGTLTPLRLCLTERPPAGQELQRSGHWHGPRVERNHGEPEDAVRQETAHPCSACEVPFRHIFQQTSVSERCMSKGYAKTKEVDSVYIRGQRWPMIGEERRKHETAVSWIRPT
jgi:hypothetical protein